MTTKPSPTQSDNFNYGAAPEDWSLFADGLGLTADLLPVVSKPAAAISATSTMKALGKTPSRYNKDRKVVGIAKWTERTTTPGQVARWMQEPDYGICVQTRDVRALDIDVEDEELATAIEAYVDGFLESALPSRYRRNSAKSLLAFRLAGQFGKRVLKVKDGIIEFLANGQQFIAAGTHPSGASYDWLWPDADAPVFPVLSENMFEALWMGLEMEFGIAPSSEGGLRNPRTEGAASNGDDVIGYLDEQGYVLDYGREGQAFITCPFESDHTQDSGPTATAYFPAGTRGYEQGHFVCLHAHCAERGDTEFLDAFGYRMAQFDSLPALCAEEDSETPWPTLYRDKQGRIMATLNNTLAAVGSLPFCGYDIRLDNFKSEIVFAPANDPGNWRPFGDTDYTTLRSILEKRGFKPVAKELARDVVHKVARDSEFDTAIAWLSGLEWDGVPRVSRFLTDCIGAADDDYSRAVSEYMWTALAGRVLTPGVKADMVPVLAGVQGARKSSALEELVVSPEHFGTIDLMVRDADQARLMRGKLIMEIGELRGIHSREMEAIKEFITRRYENFVPKYQEFAITYPRRCLFIGTTNKDEFLADVTGNRRWLPVRCGLVDIEAVRAQRLQLWAEAAGMYLKSGVAWEDAERLGRAAQKEFEMSDCWDDLIEAWLAEEDMAGQTPLEKGYVTLTEVMEGALHFPVGRAPRGDQLRAGDILRKLGFEKKVVRTGKKLMKAWVQKGST